MGGCASTAVLPEGSVFTPQVPQDPFAAQKGWDEEKFVGQQVVKCSDEAAARRGLDACYARVLRMDIFESPQDENGVSRPPVVSFPPGKSEVELDMLIAVTTWLSVSYCTSLERICVLEHIPGESFSLCSSACLENVIDGYKRIRCTRDGASVEVEYAKVQSLNRALLRMVVGADKYVNSVEVNKTSAKSTVSLLQQHIEKAAAAAT